MTGGFASMEWLPPPFQTMWSMTASGGYSDFSAETGEPRKGAGSERPRETQRSATIHGLSRRPTREDALRVAGVPLIKGTAREQGRRAWQ